MNIISPCLDFAMTLVKDALSPTSASTPSPKSASCSPWIASTRSEDTSPATAKSSQSPLIVPKAVPAMSHKPPSTDSSADSPESGKDATLVQCVCGRPFLRLFQEQTRCQRCRQLQLAADGRRNDGPEIDAFGRMLDKWKDDDSWMLVDPDHPDQMIKATDLAKRYREQTRPRPVRGSLRRWL